ncbi:ammonium transporter [Leifsonia sp. ZF2019]|uniref:ammonium transporter n=1 Tax=Leifsonia sp. ZF2019 TaxID=2781978 RepID=UPI001CBBBFF6|nr:ammonium transporter [Leifsonia sp. ZF2019]UAJ77988.1 ammonium transporter [Leifsonia sp. ZF2019]
MATSDQVDALLLFFCGALTLLVVPGLAFLVGGLAGRARARRALLFVLTGTAVVVVLAVLGGYGMLAGESLLPHIVGAPDVALAGQRGAYALARAGSLIAVCAVAIAVVGAAVASRITLGAWLLFCAAWSVLVLFPVGYAVFALSDGWAVSLLGVVDYGGALPVGLAAGASAVGVIVACGRGEHPAESGRSLPVVAIGGTLVWVGWLGLVTGSEGAVDQYTATIAINAFLASAAGCLMWMLVDRVLLRRPTLVSVFCGAASGLVAITPASGVLTLGWSLLLGALAALACATMVDLAARARFGPALALCVIMIVGSAVGLLFVGLFGAGGGMVESGNFDLFIAQGVAAVAVLVYAFVIALLIAVLLRFTVGLTRVRYGAERGIPSTNPERDRPAVPSERGSDPLRTDPRPPRR